MISIYLPGTPVPQSRPRFTRQGHTYKAPRTAAYAKALALAAKEVMAGRKPLEGAVSVIITIDLSVPASWPKGKRAIALNGMVHPTSKPDLDNFIKQLDALNGIAWIDDSQVSVIHAAKRYADRPGMSIVISPWL